ncbi:MAG: cation diffusion facilitator family transporter [Chloroflexota bacterium]
MAGAPARIAAISLVVTCALLVLKLTLGLISGSIAVLGDAVDSGTDLVGGAAALISVYISRAPADDAHPYGHGKVEGISASVAATIIALGGSLVAAQAIIRLIDGSPGIDVGVGLIAMVIAAAANTIMAMFMRREARIARSMALQAEATHLQTNIVQAGAIICGLLLVEVTGKTFFDPLTALGLAAYMAWIAQGLVRTAVDEVMDAALPASDLDQIMAVIDAHKHDIRGFHRLRTRRAGSSRHIDMHIMFDASSTVHEAHLVADAISEDIHQRLPGSVVVVHVEPDEPHVLTEAE